LAIGSGYAIYDAGKALAGAAGPLVVSAGTANCLGGGAYSSGSTQQMLSSDGFGAPYGICAAASTVAGQINVGTWVVNSVGALGWDTLITSSLTGAALGAASRIRVVRTAPNLWAVFFPSASGGQ